LATAKQSDYRSNSHKKAGGMDLVGSNYGDGTVNFGRYLTQECGMPIWRPEEDADPKIRPAADAEIGSSDHVCLRESSGRQAFDAACASVSANIW